MWGGMVGGVGGSTADGVGGGAGAGAGGVGTGGQTACGLRETSRQPWAVPGALRAQEAHTQGDRTDGAAGEVGAGVPGLQRLMLPTGPEPSPSWPGHP